MTLPGDVIETTIEQQRAMKDILAALREEDDGRAIFAGESQVEHGKAGKGCCGSSHRHRRQHHHSRALRLARAIRRFYIGLICYEFLAIPFRSLVISLYAKLSRSPPRSGWSRRRKDNGERPDADHRTEVDGAASLLRGHKLGHWVKPNIYTSGLAKLIWGA